MTRSRTKPPGTDSPVLRIRTPDDAANAVPYLLGFYPENSLVAMPFGEPARRQLGQRRRDRGPAIMRVDLPSRWRLKRDLDPWCDQLLPPIAYGGSTVLLLAYTADADLAEIVVDRLQHLLAPLDVRVTEALRIAGGRWFSLTCADERCCPPEGVPFDARSSVFAAQAAFEGRGAAPSRGDLAREIEPVSGPARAQLAAAFERALTQLRMEEADRGAGGVDDAGCSLIQQTLKRWRSGQRSLSDDELARLAVRVARIPVRDEAWRLIRDPWRETHRALWAEVVRRAEPPFDVAPACLLAVTAYVDGNGTMARIALDRALDRDPDCSMALLVHTMLDRVVSPQQMRDMIEGFDGATMADPAGDG